MKGLKINKGKVTKNKILIKPIHIESINEGAVRSVEYSDKPELGEVLVVGAKVEEVEIGDKIYFNKYSATPLNLDGEDFYTLLEEDVIIYWNGK